MFDLSEADIQRFWSKVDQRGPDECWPWTSKARLTSGYGVFSITSGPKKARNHVASRVSAFLAYGVPSRPNAKALHSCDNPICVNPAHLRWGDQKDNVADAVARKRHSPPPRNAHYRVHNPRRGEAAPNSTLSEPVVRHIIRLHMAGETAKQIAQIVGFSTAAVADVCSGKSWRHLHGRDGIPTLEEIKSGGVRRDKLTEGDKAMILARLALGDQVKDIARDFGVSTAPISNLKNHGTTWVPKRV